jgi:hypothetical protein
MKYYEIKTPSQLLEYMETNIFYGFLSNKNKIYIEINEEWKKNWYKTCVIQDASSLIKSHYGTCWDQVELERDWFEKSNYNLKTIFMLFDVKTPNNYPTHTFLLFEENNKVYWFEHAFGHMKGIHEFENLEEAIKVVKEKHFEYALNVGIAKNGDIEKIKCFEYSKPKSQIGVKEYLEHVLSGKQI